jgi:hypothetical protein
MPTAPPVNAIPIPIRTPCPPGACACDRERLLADPQADRRVLLLTRADEQRLIARIERVDSYADLQRVQALMLQNLGVALRIAPGVNEVKSVRGIIVVLEDQPGLCKKIRQSIPAAIRRTLEAHPQIMYDLLDANDLFGG